MKMIQPSQVMLVISLIVSSCSSFQIHSLHNNFKSISNLNSNYRRFHGDLSASLDTDSSVEGKEKQDNLDLPWGDRQKWALKDNISKYTVEIPQLEKAMGTKSFVMWRALCREHIELTGYDVEFLQSKYISSMQDDSDDKNQDKKKKEKKITIPGSLPLLDNFEFQSNGGVSGKIQGLKGIADGTTVQTSPLVHVQLTIPRGYVLTEDGSSAYELGQPLSEESYSLDIANMNVKNIDADGVKKTLKAGVDETGKVASNIVEAVGDQETTNMLVNLGASTAILLGGATAFNMLQHHLTVNVFWV